MMSEEQKQWHRWFGLAWTDHLHGEPATVEMERDLSIRQQFLDVVIVRTEPGAPLGVEMPDGFEAMARHNLISFKSFQEKFDPFHLAELIGHYANYRKQVSPSRDDLVPEEDFRMYAVGVRFPLDLSRLAGLEERSPGVYDMTGFGMTIRFVAVHNLPLEVRNAILHLFSYREADSRFACTAYRLKSPATSTFLNRLIERYRAEGFTMPYTVEEHNREYILEELRRMTPEQRLAGVTPEQRLEGVPLRERIRGADPEEMLGAMSEEQRRRLLELLQQTPPEAGPG